MSSTDDADHAAGHRPAPEHWGRKAVVQGYAVHLLTASGIIPAFAAMAEIVSDDCDPRWVFAYLFLATLIDAVDGPLARRWHVKTVAPAISGRTVDDLLDYLTFAFIPLMLVWRMQWLPMDFGWTVVLAMGASLLGFAHSGAKREEEGFFRGFPSYWNIFAFYAGLITPMFNAWVTLALLLLLTVATVSPIWLLYPNLTPYPYRPWVLGGAAVWAMILLIMIPFYPRLPVWVTLISLVYPLGYTLLSFWLSWRKLPKPASGPD